MSSVSSTAKNGLSCLDEKAISGQSTARESCNFNSITVQDYDNLKKQCDQAMEELNLLKRQHSETTRRFEYAMKELNYYRIQNCSDVKVNESNEMNCNNRLTVSDANTKRLNDALQPSHDELKCSETLLIENNNTDSSLSIIRRNEDYDNLLKKYDDLMAAQKSTALKMESFQSEIGSLNEQCDTITKERNNLKRECIALKQQCTAAIRQWDMALKERNEFQDAYNSTQRQHEDTVKEINQIMAVRILANNDISRLQEERDAAVQEYRLIMNERDSVHKEIEKLNQDLITESKKCDVLEKQKKKLIDQNQILVYQNETLRREITSSLNDRDEAIKERNEVQERFSSLRNEPNSSLDCHKDSNGNLNGSHDLVVDRNGISFSSNAHFSEFESMKKELDTLKKALDKVNLKLTDTIEEAEVARGRRDWAFSERDKIVFEKENLLALCERLRKERDRATNDLSQALHDLNNQKKEQQGATCKELNEIELQRRLSFRCSCKHSSEVTYNNLIVTRIPSKASNGLFLDKGFYISKINLENMAVKECSLAVGDRVLSINNKNVNCFKDAQDAMTYLNNNCSNIVIITTQRSYGIHKENNYFHQPKKVNSSTQTEIIRQHLENDILDCRFMVPSNNNNISYKMSKNVIGEKSSGTWELIRGKLDMVRDKIHHRNDDKKKYNSPPSRLILTNNSNGANINPENDAIAELDSVLDSYHGKSSISDSVSSSYKRTKRRSKEISTTDEKNSGTWPKARGNIVHNITGTVTASHKKERMPLSIILDESSLKMPSNSITRPERYSVYKSAENNGRSNFSKVYLPVTDSFEKLKGLKFNHNHHTNRYSIQAESNINYPSSKSDGIEYYNDNNNSSNKITKSTNMSIDRFSSLNSRLVSKPPQSSYTHPHSNSLPVHLLNPQITDNFAFEPAYFTKFQPTLRHNHQHNFSIDVNYQHKRNFLPPNPQQLFEPLSVLYTNDYEGRTYPRKKENSRVRIPSNHSVASKNSIGKISSGSIERNSERGSPVPSFHVEVLSPGSNVNKRNSLPPDYCWPRKPAPGELRRVHIFKSCQTLGINISCLNKGIFVSTVKDNSLASQVGLQIGDQLLEVCGINMRNATYSLAERVLRHCSNSITMLVQYQPDKYHELEDPRSWSASGEEDENEITPHNSPDKSNNSSMLSTVSNEIVHDEVEDTRKGSNNSNTLTHNQIARINVMRNNNDTYEQHSILEKPRYVRIQTHVHSNLGISLVGGNAVGIFINSVGSDSIAAKANLKQGDHVLEFNGISFRSVTAEQAAYEFAKPAVSITLLVHYDMEKYSEIKDLPGDSLYIRCGFDRNSLELSENYQLNFYKDDVLYIDSTMVKGIAGHWRAWKLDHEGNKQHCGIIPSKYKVDELLLRRHISDIDGRISSAARRSFFRKKKNSRNDSRDSKELASFSNILFGWNSDSGTINEDFSIYSYQRVERIEYPTIRPVLILGPLSECVVEKLITDFPDQFQKCVPKISEYADQNFLECGDIIEFKRKGNFVQCVTIQSIEAICNQKFHCIIDIAVNSIEKLHQVHIYPIVLLIKFKSTKQIREIKDGRFQVDKVSAKAAKEMYEHCLKLEAEYKQFISAIIPAGSNIAYMSTQIKSTVDIEQNKSLWVPCKNQL